MMCAKSLKITFAKDYKLALDSIYEEFGTQLTTITNAIVFGRLFSGGYEYDEANKAVTMREFGDVMSYFTYAYRTGDTAIIPKEHKDLYDRLSKGVNSCVSGTDSITDVADNICKWLISNSNRTVSSRSTYRGSLNSTMKYDTDGKIILNCEGYACVFMIMMRMAGYTAYNVHGTILGGRHAWSAIKVGDEYRYYDAGWTSTPDNMTYKELLKEGYKPTAYYRDENGVDDITEKPTQKQVEALFIDWH